MNRTRPVGLAACLLAGGVLLSACSSEDEHGGDLPTATATATASSHSPSAQDPTTAPEPEPATPVEQVIADLVDELNAGDASGAMGLVCEGSESVVDTAVDELAGADPGLRVEEYLAEASGSTATASGAVDGQPVIATIGAAELSTGPCVAALFIN